MSSGNDFATWRARRQRRGAVLADGSTSVLAENDLLGSTVDPDEFESWRARKAAEDRGRAAVEATRKPSIYSGYDSPKEGILPKMLDTFAEYATRRSIMPGGGIATRPDPGGADFLGSFFDDILTPAGLVTSVLPGFKGGGMVGQLTRGLGRTGSAAYGVSGADKAFTGDTTGERVLGGVEALLGTLGAFAPGPSVDPLPAPSARAQGRFTPWPPASENRGNLLTAGPFLEGRSSPRALIGDGPTGDDIIDAEFTVEVPPPGGLPPGSGGGARGALYPAALPEHGPIPLGAIPSPLERPDLLSDEALYDEFTKAVLSNKFDDLAVFEAEVARRGPARGVAPSSAAVPDARLPEQARTSIFEDPEVAAELERLRKRAAQISTVTKPTPIDRTPRRSPAPEFEPVQPLESVPRGTSPLEAVPDSTGDDLVDALLSPEEAAYQTVLRRYQAGEQFRTDNRLVNAMGSVRDAKEAARAGILDTEAEDVIGAGRSSATPTVERADVRGLRSEPASPSARGLEARGGPPDRPVGGRARQLSPEDADRLSYYRDLARRRGFAGSDDELDALITAEFEPARAIADDLAMLTSESGESPLALLQAVAEEGGISTFKESRGGRLWGTLGEINQIQESAGGFTPKTGKQSTKVFLPGVKGHIINRAAPIPGVQRQFVEGAGRTLAADGRSLDDMVSALQARGIDIEDTSDLIERLERAVVKHLENARSSPSFASTLDNELAAKYPQYFGPIADELDAAPGAAPLFAVDDALPQARTVIDDAIEPTGDVDLSFDPAKFDADSVIDELLTGEKQARLPGAGQVRAAEIATPEVADLPFTLQGQKSKGAKDLLLGKGDPTESLFDAPEPKSAPDADSLIDEALEVPTIEQLQGNVRSFLTQRLGYTADEINAMTPEQAVATGRARTPSPSRQKAPESTPELTQAKVVAREKVRAARGEAAEGRRTEFLNEFAETELPKREAMAEARRQPKQGPVAPVRFGDRRPAGEVSRLKQQDRAIREEMAADRLESERVKNMSPAERQSRAAQMASDDRGIAARIKRLMDDPDPTPEKFDEMRRLYEQQAEIFAKRQLKGGTGKEMSNDELYSFLTNNIGSMGPLAALNPRVFRELVSRWYASPAIRAMFGGFAGAAIDDESEFRGFVYGAAAAAATPSGLRALARAARLAKQGKAPWPVDPRDSGKDISWARLLLPFSPESTVPELFRDVTEQLTRLQQVFDNPAFDDNARAAIMKSAKPAIAQMIRTAADTAKSKGLKRKAFYANKLADAFESKLTAGQRAVKNAGEAAGLKLKGNEIERKVGGHVYRVLVGYALDTAAQNLTQPIMTMLYVSPRSLMRAYKVSRTDAARAMAKRFDAELPEVPELLDEDLLESVRRRRPQAEQQGVKKHSPMKLLHATDNYNRRVALLAGLEEAGVLDDALSGKLDLMDPRAQRAMSIMRKTQGHFGAMGNNPLYRGPVMGSVKPFTKYPFMFVERALDVFQDPDAKGLQYVATLLGAALAGKTIGIDLEDLLLGGGRPLGLDLSDPEETAGRILSGDAFPAGRAVKDVAAHATGTADHSVFEDLPTLAAGRYPMKVADKVKNHLAVHGTGEHKTASGTAPDHDGYDDILSLLGLQTAERGEKLKARDEAYEFNKFSNRAREERNRSLRDEYRKAVERGDRAKMRALEQEMSEGQRRSLRRSTQQTPYERLREQTPREQRKEFDRRFRDRLEDK